MLIKDCQNCRAMVWMVGVGQGVRCSHPDNQKETKHSFNGKLPLISEIIDCQKFEEKSKL